MQKLSYQRSTVLTYLAEFVRHEKPASVEAWIAPALYRQIAAAVRRVGGDALKPIYMELGEKVSYEDIRLVVAYLQGATNQGRS